MAGKGIIATLIFIALLSAPVACSKSESTEQESVFKKIPEIVEIKPQKPVKIKLKRSTNGNYSWELSGDDADRIIEADRKLREAMNNQRVSH